ncbi:ELOVL7 [Lepeophtheirus salmonis]|uniref:Elongation of very long chain fatty acids protein n=1 Tax=Lepeophtheirus salmonis TaxID=72036 RepID=A0A7R8CY30_LEPSM|nr:ELOVL7 [Lepeophtheirus salmonis]CAF2937717.1 ELOVL7 [Lepeophtheirus salmonis]
MWIPIERRKKLILKSIAVVGLILQGRHYDYGWNIVSSKTTCLCLGTSKPFWLFYYGISLGWATHYNWVCQPVEKDATPNSLPMQMAEMEKKNNQVSFLHVFHHSSMPLFSWILLRWAPGGHETFGGVINALVHVFMYSYYFLSSLGPSIAPYLWWKNSVILLGIVDCGFPWQISLMSLSIIIPFIGLFSNFFVVEYSKRKNAYLKKNNDPNSNYLVDIKKSS